MKKSQIILCVLLVLSLLTIPLGGCTKRPTLTVNEPRHGATVSESPVRVQGTVSDAKATVRINNTKILVSKAGSFAARVTLTEGENTINIVATRGKKSASRVLTVTHAPPLSLEINSPEDGTTATESLVIVSGVVSSPKATTKVNDVEVEVAEDGAFSTNVELAEGENVITIVAALGEQTVTRTARVTHQPEQ